MAQHFKYNEGQYKYFPDAVTGLRCRSGQRDKRFVEDAEIVPGGFSLAENVGWVNIGGNALQITGNQIWEGGENIGGTNYYIVKGELTATGFAGTEDLDWITIDAIPLSSLNDTFKYYVNPDGNDANTGLSDAQAWQTMAKVNSFAFVPGDKIGFKKGGTWREQITPQSGSILGDITYGAYGVGAKPLFLGSVQANKLTDWADQGGNIWQNSNAAFTVDVGNLIFNNEESCGVKIMSAIPTFTTQGQFWYDFVNDRIRMYSVGNPASVYSNIECVLKYNALDMTETTSHITFQNLDFRYWGICVWENRGNYLTFRDIDLSYIGGSDQNGDYTVRYGNGLQIWEGNSHDITIERCRIDNVYDAGISPQGYAGGYEVYNIYMRNNVISNCEYNFEFYERDATVSVHDIYFEDNTCVNAGGGWGHNQRPDGVNGSQIRLAFFNATKSNIYIRNNIFSGATERLFLFGTTNDLTNIVIDNNILYQATGYIGKIGVINYNIISEWRTASGQDANSILADPLFVSASDLHLQNASPAIDEGLVISGRTKDYDNQLIVGLPDIGALENQTGLSGIYTNRPTRLKLTGISGGVRLDWMDHSNGVFQTEIWGGNNTDASALLYTINAGIITKDNACTPVDLRYYKLRGKNGAVYTEFSPEQSIAMLGSELVVNGDFTAWTVDNPNGWTVQTESGVDPMITQVAGGCRLYTSTALIQISQVILNTTDTFLFGINIVTRTAGTLVLQWEGTTKDSYNTTGLKTYQGTSLGIHMYLKRFGGVTDIVFNNVSLKKVLFP